MMPKPKFYRYFLAIRPPASLYSVLQAWIEAAGQARAVGLIHLTFCVIAESGERDRFIAARVRRALNGQPLHSFPVNFSRIVSGPQGAFARPFGKQDEIQDFYRRLVRLLGAWGIEPMYRKSGFHPHSTLGYSPCAPRVRRVALRWFPSELLLIESEYGLTRHNLLARWPLLPTRQPVLCRADDAGKGMEGMGKVYERAGGELSVGVAAENRLTRSPSRAVSGSLNLRSQ